jgi:hypothetical protein
VYTSEGSKDNGEGTAAIKNGNGRPLTGPIEKANSLNFYYSSAFSCERSISGMQCANSCQLLAISTKIITRRFASIGKNKSAGPDGGSGEILNSVGKP